jgi:hypothetical protein
MENDGFVEAWVDGQPITPFNGTDHKIYAPTVINRAGNYFRIGLYRDAAAGGKEVLYYDEVKIGKSYLEVMP